MKPKPILFSTPMVKALLEDRKTQTRRLLKPQPPRRAQFPGASFSLCPAVADGIRMFSQNDYERLPKHPTKWDLVGSVGVARDAGFPTVYDARYAVGDLLWVRETWARAGDNADDIHGSDGRLYYRADYIPGPDLKWRSAIHIPRWASRLTLEVTAVRMHRLREITDLDARAEGFVPPPQGGSEWHAFLDYWNELHGDGATDANPYVVALTFNVHRCNVDALIPQRAAA